MKIGFLTERMFRGFGVDRVFAQLAEWWMRTHQVEVWSVFSDGSYDDRIPIRIFPVGLNRFTPWYELTALRRKRILPEKDLWIVTHPLAVMCHTHHSCIFYEFGISPPWGRGGMAHLNYFYQFLSNYYLHLKKARNIVAGSQFLFRSLPPFLRKMAVVIPPGCDHYIPPPPEDVQKFREENSPRGLPILFYAGRFHHAAQPYKGVQDLVNIFAQFRGACVLVIAGYGSEEEAEKMRTQGIKVYRLVSDEQMAVLFSGCDVYVTASRWEGVDLPALEAQYFGKPVLAFHRGAHPEFILHQQTGLLAHSINEFVDYWKKLLQEKQMREEMGSRAKEWAQKFSWHQCFSSWHTLLEGLR
ncbi:MAG: glycosyltransferase family 4 protein [bacterium]